jgi:hypothetical protein
MPAAPRPRFWHLSPDVHARTSVAHQKEILEERRRALAGLSVAEQDVLCLEDKRALGLMRDSEAIAQLPAVLPRRYAHLSSEAYAAAEAAEQTAMSHMRRFIREIAPEWYLKALCAEDRRALGL